MTQRTDIGWGKYSVYSGPFFRGEFPWPYDKINKNSNETDKRMTVITSTEGGRASAINMYDKCIMTVGYIQWCDGKQFSVCDMLGEISRADLPWFKELLNFAKSIGYNFQNIGNKYRWVQSDSGSIVDNEVKQRKMYLLNSDGTDSSWDEASKDWAKDWAVNMSNVFKDEEARNIQVKFTVDRLESFVLPTTKKLLFGPAKNEFHAAAQAVYMSFAVNNPMQADKWLKESFSQKPEFTEEWLINICKNMTFGPKFSIYPARYNAIRPHVERLYGVNLPDFAEELRKIDLYNKTENPGPTGTLVDLSTTAGVQKALISLGFDLGPAGADGIWGNKTKKAIIDFQISHKLSPDGIVGPRTKEVITSELCTKSQTLRLLILSSIFFNTSSSKSKSRIFWMAVFFILSSKNSRFCLGIFRRISIDDIMRDFSCSIMYSIDDAFRYLKAKNRPILEENLFISIISKIEKLYMSLPKGRSKFFPKIFRENKFCILSHLF